MLYKLSYKQLGPGEWKRLAQHWAFTEEQIRAIEHQYTGPSSYKEHGFRMMLIWAHGLAQDVNPVKELYESLVAIDKKHVAGKSCTCVTIIINHQYLQTRCEKNWTNRTKNAAKGARNARGVA